MSEARADLSVVIPVRDGEATLLLAIDSVLARADRLLEVIVIDDASTDASAQLAASHPDPRVRLITGRGIGPAAARNDGVAAARGTLIGFVDADDEWLAGSPDPRRALLRGPRSIAAGYVQLRRGGVDQGAPGPLPTFGSVLVTRELALAEPFDEQLRQGEDDLEWTLRLGDAGYEIARTEAVVNAYCRRPGSMAPDLRHTMLAGLHATIKRRQQQPATPDAQPTPDAAP